MSKSQIFTADQISSLRKSGKILRECLLYVATLVKPEITTLELDAAAERFIRDRGGKPTFMGYRGYRHTLCVSINEEVVHGIPRKRIVKEGDIISLDGGVTIDGLCTDACITVPVGSISSQAQRLLDVTAQALQNAIDVARAGCHVGDISSVVQKTVEEEGFLCVRALTGHGVGVTLHQFPDVPNVGKPGSGPVLPAGTAIAIEPIVTAGGSDEIDTGDDGWTICMADGALSAHFEHTVLITEDGCEVLA